MLDAKITDVFNEPGCDKNQAKSDSERKKGCGAKTLTPGAAAGGCAFDGAMVALQPITDAAHLVHGPLACAGNGWDVRNSGSSGPMLYMQGLTTDLSELDIIHGGEKKLWKAIKLTIEKFSPPAIFVYQTCVPALIGDDVTKVCQVATERLGTPVIAVNAPGFAGSKNLGNKLGGEALLDHVIGTREPEVITDTDINIIGEYNVAGEMWNVLPLLEKLGIRVQAAITGDARYRDVASCHRVKVNMLVCSQAMVNLARKMEERYGIPYFEGSWYGIADCSTSLREIARMIVEQGGPADLPARAEALIKEEEAKAWAAIQPYKERLTGRKVLLYTGGVKTWSVVSALMEAGMQVVGTSVRKATENDKARVKAIMGEAEAMFDKMPPKDMFAMLERGEADIMLSGGRTQFIALKARVPWLDVNQERHHQYAGYEGMVEMVRQIDRSLSNPMWDAIRAPAPWDKSSPAKEA